MWLIVKGLNLLLYLRKLSPPRLLFFRFVFIRNSNLLLLLLGVHWWYSMLPAFNIIPFNAASCSSSVDLAWLDNLLQLYVVFSGDSGTLFPFSWSFARPLGMLESEGQLFVIISHPAGYEAYPTMLPHYVLVKVKEGRSLVLAAADDFMPRWGLFHKNLYSAGIRTPTCWMEGRGNFN